MKTMAKVLSAMVLVMSTWSLWGAANAANRGETAEQQRMTVREFNRWTRNWDKRLLDMLHTDPATYTWGKKKRPAKSRIIVLNPPLAKTIGPNQVEVEWFYTPIDERGSIKIWVFARGATTKWDDSRAKDIPVRMIPRIVGKGPGVPARFETNYRLFQEMVLAWEGDENTNISEAGGGAVAIMVGSRKESLSTINTLEQTTDCFKRWYWHGRETKTRTSVKQVEELWR